MSDLTKKWPNVLRGCAYGDAYGAPNEFRRYEDLIADDLRGPEMPEKLIITDDTQMTLALARGIDAGLLAGRVTTTSDAVLADTIRQHVTDEFVTWYNDPDNNRAPGTTCLSACRALAAGDPWWRATVPDSDGCGAVMRVSPAAFLPDGLWQPVTAWQAAATHGHPAAIASALIAAAVIRRAARGLPFPDGVLRGALEFADNISPWKVVGDWLTAHPLAGSKSTACHLMDLGMAHVREALLKAMRAVPVFADDPWSGDPSDSKYGGEGWNAQTCLATALLCVDMFPGDPVEALRRATVTGGDSDSIAAVAGAVLGAMHDDPWPAEWAERLEPRYQKWIAEADTYRFDDAQVSG